MTERSEGEVGLTAGLSAETALQRLDDECWDLRCCSGAIADTGDYDVWWEVHAHRMGLRGSICIGTGNTPLAAVFDATLPHDDERRSDYVPPEVIEAWVKEGADNALHQPRICRSEAKAKTSAACNGWATWLHRYSNDCPQT